MDSRTSVGEGSFWVIFTFEEIHQLDDLELRLGSVTQINSKEFKKVLTKSSKKSFLKFLNKFQKITRSARLPSEERIDRLTNRKCRELPKTFGSFPRPLWNRFAGELKPKLKMNNFGEYFKMNSSWKLFHLNCGSKSHTLTRDCDSQCEHSKRECKKRTESEVTQTERKLFSKRREIQKKCKKSFWNSSQPPGSTVDFRLSASAVRSVHRTAGEDCQRMCVCQWYPFRQLKHVDQLCACVRGY